MEHDLRRLRAWAVASVPTPGRSVDTTVYWLVVGLFAIVVVVAAISIWRYWQGNRHEQMLLRLLDEADRLEARIKQLRDKLGQAHAAVSVMPGVPSAGSANADAAIDKALRNLLEHRLWLRDKAPTASYRELQRAAEALEAAARGIDRQMQQLQSAREELDHAVHSLEALK